MLVEREVRTTYPLIDCEQSELLVRAERENFERILWQSDTLQLVE